jgi:WD40 repeat protein
MTNAREATLSSPDKTRTDNQEICRRGEAPPPDQQRPLLSTCAVHPGEITAVRFTRDGRSLVSLGGGYKVWNLSDRTLLATIPTERVANSPRQIMLSADEQLLLTGTEAQNHSVTVWKLFQGEPIGEYRTAPGDTVGPLGFSLDNHSILAFSQQQGLLVWDLTSHQIVLAHPLVGIDQCTPYPSTNLQFIAIVCNTANGTQAHSQFYVWDSQTRNIVAPPLRTPEIYGIEFSDDERVMGVGTGGRPTDFDFYDTTSWTATYPASEVAQLLRMRIELSRGYGELFWLPDPRPDRRGYRTNAYKVAMSRDGSTRVVYPEGPYNLRLVDTRTGQTTDLCPTGCYGGSPILHALAMSPDQRWLAAVYGGGISLWDLPAKQLVTSLHNPLRGEGNPPTTPHIQPVATTTLASQCASDLADACYQHGLNERRAGHRAEAEAILQKACGLRGSYCLELAKVAKSEGEPANELRWLEAACQQRERQGCQQWMYAAESKGDDPGVQSALLGTCKIDAGYCPALLVKADKTGTTTHVIDLVCSTTADGCESLGKSLESVQRLVHAQRAYHLACQQGKAHSCGRETELNPRVKPARATS